MPAFTCSGATACGCSRLAGPRHHTYAWCVRKRCPAPGMAPHETDIYVIDRE
jgi:hypothetical protein